MHDNQHAIDLFFTIFPRKPRMWLNWGGYSLFVLFKVCLAHWIKNKTMGD